MKKDAERLKEFKELKESIRTNPNYLIVGIDAAKLKHHACFMLSSGRIVAKDFGFNNTLKGFEEFLGRIEMLQKKTGSSKVVCGGYPTNKALRGIRRRVSTKKLLELLAHISIC